MNDDSDGEVGDVADGEVGDVALPPATMHQVYTNVDDWHNRIDINDGEHNDAGEYNDGANQETLTTE